MTLNKNKGTNRRITVMLLITVLIMSLFAFPATATEDGAGAKGGNVTVAIDTENADHASVRVNGAETESVSFARGEEFNLEITADEGYFIRKILVVKENADGDEEETIIPLKNDKSYKNEEFLADGDMTIEVKITSESFRFFDMFLPLDLFVFEWVQGIRNPVLTVLMTVVTTLGDEGILFIAVGIIFLITKKYRKIGLAMLVALVVMLICNNFVLKEIFARERPFNLFATFPDKYHEWGGEAAKYIYPNLVKAPHSYSFPSGHTSSAFAAGIAVFLLNKKIGIPATLFAFVMGFTRIYVGVHYTTDVISAAIVGIVYAILGVLIANRLFPLADKILDKVLAKISEKLPKKKKEAAAE